MSRYLVTRGHRPAGSGSYFVHWWSRWNLCAPEAFGLELRSLIAERVGVTACEGHIERIEIAPNRLFTGFVGEVSFGFL